MHKGRPARAISVTKERVAKEVNEASISQVFSQIITFVHYIILANYSAATLVSSFRSLSISERAASSALRDCASAWTVSQSLADS